MEVGRTVVEVVSDREVRTTRVFSRTRAVLFRAWTEAEHLARWWGPAGFTNTFEIHEPRAQGEWRFVMRGPDGKEYKNRSVYSEVRAPERIAFQHLSGPVYQATVDFEETPGGTRVVWRMAFESPAVFAKLEALVVQGNRDNMDRLEAELARMP